LRAKRDATSKRIGKEIREREETKRPPVKNRRRKIAIFRHALRFHPKRRAVKPRCEARGSGRPAENKKTSRDFSRHTLNASHFHFSGRFAPATEVHLLWRPDQMILKPAVAPPFLQPSRPGRMAGS
jgi:hypothetical protein